jgi:hypothetical protein
MLEVQVDRCLEAENALIKTTAIMRPELHVVMTSSSNLKMLLVSNISVAISSGSSLKEANLACKNFIGTGDHVELQHIQEAVVCTGLHLHRSSHEPVYTLG